jgi:hypothetical protein
MAESYFQHAEHYFRILNAMNQAQQQQGGQHQPHQRRYQNGPEQDQGDGSSDGGEVNGQANGHAMEAEPGTPGEEGSDRN